MEQWIATRLIGEEVEMICVSGERLKGRVEAVEQGILTLAWDDRESYVACDKIISIWAVVDDTPESPNIGFIR